ncbi:zinc finger Ran-binding domain-containing protein [Streptomyces sp. NPDC002104]
MTETNWRCRDCDEFNAQEEKNCTTCGTRRSGAAPGPWTCVDCSTRNDPTDPSCIACGTGWKASAQKAAARKRTAPKAPGPRPAPGASTRTSSPAGSRGTSGRSGTRTGTGTGPGPGTGTGTGAKTPAGGRAAAPGFRSGPTRVPPASSRPTPERGEAFFPPPATVGYIPPAAHRTAPPPPPPPPYVPPAPPPPDPRVWLPPGGWTPPAGRKSGGGKGCLALIVVPVALYALSQGCSALSSSFGTGGGSTPASEESPRSAGTCPGRIADSLPDGAGASLETAFRTGNKQITLCLTTGGKLYYFGEFSDRREPGIAMPAVRTAKGYTARNDPYRYEIHDGVVTIYRSGNRIGEESLTPEPSPG